MERSMLKDAGLYLMAALYIAAGINHFLNPKGYVSIMPGWLPNPLLLVNLSGCFEIVLGILLIPFETRRIAAWGIILLLAAVFPANIQMMLNYNRNHHPLFWITVLRLPLQFLLGWWAWVYTW